MESREIKELYLEELALLKRVQGYGETQPQENLERVEKVTLLLLFRIFSNLYSALLLTTTALKKQNMTFYQLPIGIIVRCCFTDCLFALYIQRVGEKRANEELELRTIEYANSMLERKEVYRDQVKSAGLSDDDDFIDHIWELTMEDNFLHLLSINVNEAKQGLEVTKRSKEQLKEDKFSYFKSVGIKEQKDFLIEQEGLEVVTKKLYHYYKYFSQYEHFSENGQGDVLATSKENANDNVHLPSAIKALSAGVEEVIRIRDERSAARSPRNV